MPQYSFENYLSKIANLRQGNTKYGPAPHKPILLLTIVNGIAEKNISQNSIAPDDLFLSLFTSTWNEYVSTNHSLNLAFPFFHLQRDLIWHVNVRNGNEMWWNALDSLNSIKLLRERIEYGYLDQELFNILLGEDKRNVVRETIIKHYFKR